MSRSTSGSRPARRPPTSRLYSRARGRRLSRHAAPQEPWAIHEHAPRRTHDPRTPLSPHLLQAPLLIPLPIRAPEPPDPSLTPSPSHALSPRSARARATPPTSTTTPTRLRAVRSRAILGTTSSLRTSERRHTSLRSTVRCVRVGPWLLISTLRLVNRVVLGGSIKSRVVLGLVVSVYYFVIENVLIETTRAKVEGRSAKAKPKAGAQLYEVRAARRFRRPAPRKKDRRAKGCKPRPTQDQKAAARRAAGHPVSSRVGASRHDRYFICTVVSEPNRNGVGRRYDV